MKDVEKAFRFLQKAADDLDDANLLKESDRTTGAINRAYYALFHCITALLYTTGGNIPKTHTGVHTEFRKQFILTNIFPATDSALITNLFNMRQGGDYELDFDISTEDVTDALQLTTDFYQRVKSYLIQNYPVQ